MCACQRQSFGGMGIHFKTPKVDQKVNLVRFWDGSLTESLAAHMGVLANCIES